MDAYVLEVKDRFEKTIAALKASLAKLRSGRANPAMLEGIKCDYYGDKMDITALCSISMPEPRQLLVKPYSREDLKTIATAINAAAARVTAEHFSTNGRVALPRCAASAVYGNMTISSGNVR